MAAIVECPSVHSEVCALSEEKGSRRKAEIVQSLSRETSRIQERLELAVHAWAVKWLALLAREHHVPVLPPPSHCQPWFDLPSAMLK